MSHKSASNINISYYTTTFYITFSLIFCSLQYVNSVQCNIHYHVLYFIKTEIYSNILIQIIVASGIFLLERYTHF